MSAILQYATKVIRLFSKTPEVPEDSVKLVTIAVSHYCEKARWALDLSPLKDSYVEDAHPPAFHGAVVVAVTKDAKATGTPLLVFPDGTFIQDSSAIVQHLSKTYPMELGHLYPPGLEDKVKTLEHELSEKFGPQTRKIAYWEFSLAREAGLSTANPAVEEHLTKVEGLLWRLMEGKILPKMVEVLGINEDTVAIALDDCRAYFKKVSDMLEEQPEEKGQKTKKKYILGTDKMTAVDLTFASLAYPLLSPTQFASMGMAGERASPWIQRLKPYSDEFSATPAGQFALRLYNEERYLEKPNEALRLRTTNCNKYPWQ